MDNQAYIDMLLSGAITSKLALTSYGAQVLRDMLTTRRYTIRIDQEFRLVTTDRYFGSAFLRNCLPHESTDINRENWRN